MTNGIKVSLMGTKNKEREKKSGDERESRTCFLVLPVSSYRALSELFPHNPLLVK